MTATSPSRTGLLIWAAVFMPLGCLLGGCYSDRTLSEEEQDVYDASHASETLRLTMRDGSTLEAQPRHHIDMRTPSDIVVAKGILVNRITRLPEKFLGSFPVSLIDSVQVLVVDSVRYTRWYLRDSTMVECSDENHIRTSPVDEPAILCLDARVNDSDSLFTGAIPYSRIAAIEVESISTTKTLLFTGTLIAVILLLYDWNEEMGGKWALTQ